MVWFRASLKRFVVFGSSFLLLWPIGTVWAKTTAHRSTAKTSTARSRTQSTRGRSTPRYSSAKRSARKSANTAYRSKAIRPRSNKKAVASRSRGQQGIEGGRAREIQDALIRAKYMDGEPSGVWDEVTKNAMARFQSDNGWQSKVVPDSRALIKLGLGPNHDSALNPGAAAINGSPAESGDHAAQMQPGGAAINQ